MGDEPLMRSAGFENGATKKPTEGNYYLFVIAIDDYDKSNAEVSEDDGTKRPGERFNRLANPVIDAANITELVINKYNFEKDLSNSRVLEDYPGNVVEYNTIRTKCLYNENAKRSKIVSHIKKISSQIQENDSLLIYFAGHSKVDKAINSCSLVPFDGIDEDDESGTWLTLDNLYDIFEDSKCKDLLIILDCCFAGKAFQGMSLTEDKYFSRYVLVSSSVHEEAADGKEKRGSPFALALQYILHTNNQAYSLIDLPALKSRFEEECLLMFDEKLAQDLFYRQLPTINGLGEFVFELKDKDTPPPALLTRSFVNDLNFTKEKTLILNQFMNVQCSDLNLVVTRESNKYIHELFRAVFFSQLCIFDEGGKKEMRLALCLRKSLPFDISENFDVWSTLRASLSGDAKVETVEQAADIILGQLLDKPMMISIYCNNMTQDSSEKMISFCEDFIKKLDEAKKRRLDAGYKDEVFRKLFFIIPDSRDAGEDFFKQEELNDKLEKHCNLFINTPVDMINIPSALQWSYFAKKIIPSRNVKELAINDFFIGDQKQFSILDFIYQVCDKVKVERFQVENAILNY